MTCIAKSHVLPPRLKTEGRREGRTNGGKHLRVYVRDMHAYTHRANPFRDEKSIGRGKDVVKVRCRKFESLPRVARQGLAGAKHRPRGRMGATSTCG